MSTEEKYFYMSMTKSHPRVCQMQELLLFNDYKKLKEDYSQEVINLKIDELENSVNIYNHVSAYKTILTWLKRDRYAKRHH